MNDQTKKPNPWLMLVIIYIAAFSAPLNMFKVAALAPALIPYYNIDPSGIGLLMSAYTMTGVFMALPAGGIARKLGYKQTSLIALLISLVGAVLGCFAPDINVLFASRILEGVGLCMMGVTGVSIVTGYFPVEKRGRAMGIFTSYMALASCVGVPLLGALGDMLGFKNVWYICAAFTLVATVLVILFLKNPELPEEERNAPKLNMFKIIAQHKQLWILCAIFAIHNFVVVGVVNNFATTYLVEKFGLSMTMASLFGSVTAMCAVLSMLVAGTLSDKLKTRKLFIILGLAIGLFAVAFYYWTDNFVFIVILSICAGVEGGCIPAMSQTTGPEIVGKVEHAPVAQAFLSFGQNVGQFLGSGLFGIAAATLGWTMAGWAILVPLFIVALGLGFVLKIK